MKEDEGTYDWAYQSKISIPCNFRENHNYIKSFTTRGFFFKPCANKLLSMQMDII